MRTITICLDKEEITISTTKEGGVVDEEIVLPRDTHSARNAAHYAEVKMFAWMYEEDKAKEPG